MSLSASASSSSSSSMMITVDYAIVGGGLSGTYLANRLQKKGETSFVLLEATSVLGGRLANDVENTDEIDLGGAWIWPDYQPIVRRLVYDELKLKTIQQLPNDFSGSTRIQGGAVQIVRSLAKSIPPSNIHYETAVTKCTKNNSNDNSLTLETNTEKTFTVNKAVIVCLPPKVAEKNIVFEPALSPEKQRAMQAAHTWMAGVTKVTFVYEHAFWKDHRQAYSRIGAIPGPIFQMYDASTENVNALTAFTLVNTNNKTEIVESVTTQLATLLERLGLKELAAQVPYHRSTSIKQWPVHPYISENPNPTTIQPHPEPVPALAKPEMDGKLHFAATETDQRSPGVMEGAIGAAMRVLRELGIEY